MSSAVCFNLDLSKVLLFGNGLKHYDSTIYVFYVYHLKTCNCFNNAFFFFMFLALTCKLPMIENGVYSIANPGNFISFGTVSLVQCNVGYTFQNDSISSVSCQADRSVTELPVCVGKANKLQSREKGV